MRNPRGLDPASRVGLLGRVLLLSFLAVGMARSQAISTAPSREIFIAGEALRLTVPLDTASMFNGGYAIDSAGYAELPVVGRVHVGGQSRETLEAYLSQKLSNYLKDVNLQVRPALRLTLLGHWTHQGQYYVSPGTTVWEAVYEAGGIGGERNLGKIKVLRGSRETGVNLLDEYSRGSTLAGAGIRSGDILVIPVPRDNAGAWFWFRESLAATAQLATILSTVLTAYITYKLVEE